MAFPQYDEVFLEDAPLKKALCQIGFPRESRLQDEREITEFREALRNAYPVFNAGSQLAALMAPDGSMQQAPSQSLWMFSAVDETWRIILSPDRLTLETTQYSSVEELADRFRGALAMLARHVRPARRDRLGVRYLNAFPAPDRGEALALVNPALHGVPGAGVIDNEAELLSSLSDTRILWDRQGPNEGQMVFRHGFLPGDVPTDITEPFGIESFLIDIDLFDIRPRSFDPIDSVENLQQFHRWIYSAFRWSLSDYGFERCRPRV